MLVFIRKIAWEMVLELKTYRYSGNPKSNEEVSRGRRGLRFLASMK